MKYVILFFQIFVVNICILFADTTENQIANDTVVEKVIQIDTICPEDREMQLDTILFIEAVPCYPYSVNPFEYQKASKKFKKARHLSNGLNYTSVPTGQLPTVHLDDWLHIQTELFSKNEVTSAKMVSDPRSFDKYRPKLNDIGIKTIYIQITGHNEIVVEPEAVEDYISAICIETYLKNNRINLKHGDKVRIRIELDSKKFTSTQTLIFWGEYRSNREWYGALGQEAGFWVPAISVFATDLKPTTEGVAFAVLPLNVAWGIKWYPWQNHKFYLGTSLIGDLLIKPDANTTNNFNVANLSGGIVADISNFFLIGFAHGIKVRKNAETPKGLLVVGIQPGLLELLKKRNN